MNISDLIERLEALADQHGDLNVELDSGTLVSDVDAMYVGEGDKEPTAIVIK
jgi:hypothetical protein